MWGWCLQAMGANFYRRLTAAAADNSSCNRLVNGQSVVGMLLAGPGVFATLTFAPVAIAVFYSGRSRLPVGVLFCAGFASAPRHLQVW